MYIPKEFKNHDTAHTEEFINRHPFALLVSCSGEIPLATHLPLELDRLASGETVLRGHLARANKQSGLLDGRNVMAVFSGPHAYVSSSWYNHVNVPTWNYMAVHVYGKARLIDENATLAMLEKLMSRYEQQSENPASLGSIPQEYVSRLLKQITAFEIPVERMEAAYKLSQNRNEVDFANIINELKKRDNESVKVAEEMERIKKLIADS